MGNNRFIHTLLVSPVLATGCAERDSVPDLEFRSVGGGLGYAGNGDIEIHEGADDELPDEIIWDVMGGTVSRQIEPGVFEERLNIQGEELQDAEGPAWTPPICLVERTDHPSEEVFRMVGASGEVVFTLWQRFVFAGEVVLPVVPDVEGDPILGSQVAFSFESSHVYAGGWWSGEILTTASAEVQDASPERRLLLAALVAGECGSESIP